MLNTIGYAPWAFVAEGSIPVMAFLNARAVRILGGGVHATVLLLIVGLATALALTAVFRSSRAQIAVSAAIDAWGVFGATLRPIMLLPAEGIKTAVLGVMLSQFQALGLRWAR
jgi:uncharacterized membrane protein YdcZ (DUF606 family)